MMNTKTYSPEKSVLIFIFVNVVIIFLWIITNRLPITYFTNPDIEPFLLRQLNRTANDLFYALIFSTVYIVVLISFIRKIPIQMRLFFFIIFIPIVGVLNAGLPMIWNTEHLFSPDISTFSWKNSTEYLEFRKTNQKIYFATMGLFILVFGYVSYKKIKKIKEKSQMSF
ncbi:MAG: hypothetical protein WAU01_12275 [Saprospiraceae bacterium]